MSVAKQHEEMRRLLDRVARESAERGRSEYLGEVARLTAELQAAKDRASTSYREGYEAGRAATPHPGFRECVKCAFAWDERQGSDCPNCEVEALKQWRQRPVLASNPLDPKCASIFEVAEILASVTACMSNLAKALEEMSEKAEAAEKRAWDAEMASALRRSQVWEADSQVVTLREHLRLITKDRDEWAETAARRQGACDDLKRQVAEAESTGGRLLEKWATDHEDLKRQLGETQEALGKATERAERAEKMLTTERRS